MIRYIVLTLSKQFIQVFSRVFSNIQGCWFIFSHSRREIYPALSENRKKCPDFGLCPALDKNIHSKWSFSEKNLGRFLVKYFFFLCFLTECLWKCLSSTKPPLPCLALRYYSFREWLHFKYLRVFWIRLCLITAQ